MDRPTTLVTLPQTGAQIRLFDYLTGGEIRKVRRLFLERVKVNSDGKPVEDQTLDAGVSMDVQDLAIKFLVVDVQTKEGEPISVADRPAFIDNLPAKDSDILFNKIDELYKNSQLSEEDKKK